MEIRSSRTQILLALNLCIFILFFLCVSNDSITFIPQEYLYFPVGLLLLASSFLIIDSFRQSIRYIIDEKGIKEVKSGAVIYWTSIDSFKIEIQTERFAVIQHLYLLDKYDQIMAVVNLTGANYNKQQLEVAMQRYINISKNIHASLSIEK